MREACRYFRTRFRGTSGLRKGELRSARKHKTRFYQAWEREERIGFKSGLLAAYQRFTQDTGAPQAFKQEANNSAGLHEQVSPIGQKTRRPMRTDMHGGRWEPRYYLHSPIIGVLASQARHDSRPQSPMIRGVLSPGLVGGW